MYSNLQLEIYKARLDDYRANLAMASERYAVTVEMYKRVVDIRAKEILSTGNATFDSVER